MAFVIVLRDSIICRPPWLLRNKRLDLGTIQENLAPDPEYTEPSFLDESRDRLPRDVAETCRFGL
jgi:hypothetical protein